MFTILKKELIAPQIYLIEVLAPRIAKSAKPGQFLIVIMDKKGERIPLTVCDTDVESGVITLVFQAVGSSTKRISMFEKGDSFQNCVGPLGNPAEFVNEDIKSLKESKIVFVAGGVGAAPVYPQVKWLSQNGIKADVIIGGRSKEYILLEEEMRKVAGNLYIATDDGSSGYKGLVTNLLRDLVEKEGKRYDKVITIGPMIMMKFVCKLTEELGIKTIVSLNSIMVDGTGMCGACRVTIDGKTKFTCVDGPEFDGHLVDFDEAMRRQSLYKSEEAVIEHKKSHTKEPGCFCSVGGGE